MYNFFLTSKHILKLFCIEKYQKELDQIIFESQMDYSSIDKISELNVKF
jgi:hypothetical protein